MKKIIISTLAILFLSSSAYAEEAYFIYGQSTVVPYSIEFMPGKCAGNFDVNDHLFLRVEKIKRNYCIDDVCPVTIYEGKNCSKANTIVATGSTNLATGKSTLDNHLPRNYSIITSNYHIGIHGYFQ